MAKILVIDDDQAICEALKDALVTEGFECDFRLSGLEYRQAMADYRPDLLLLDYRLPGQTGEEVIRGLKSIEDFRSTPVIMLTGVDDEDQKVRLLELGADDYITKPYSSKELAARIRAVLRRSESTETDDSVLEASGIAIDTMTHRATVDGDELTLTLTEFRILTELVRSGGKVLSRDELRSTALGNLNVTDRTIDVHMAAVRKKLKTKSKHIQTVRGIGYRFTEPV
ncbi:MAG: response regulator transcription factor [Bdellovibrionales bacterium]|nr:response regulator transcription factor [Bdellovibrionales bacterium]